MKKQSPTRIYARRLFSTLAHHKPSSCVPFHGENMAAGKYLNRENCLWEMQETMNRWNQPFDPSFRKDIRSCRVNYYIKSIWINRILFLTLTDYISWCQLYNLFIRKYVENFNNYFNAVQLLFVVYFPRNRNVLGNICIFFCFINALDYFFFVIFVIKFVLRLIICQFKDFKMFIFSGNAHVYQAHNIIVCKSHIKFKKSLICFIESLFYRNVSSVKNAGNFWQ